MSKDLPPYGGRRPVVQVHPDAVWNEGTRCAQLSLIFGIVGFFTVGFILGPLAIVYAHKAERAGARSTVGKVLGWILTTISVLGAAVVIAIAIAASATYRY